MKTAGRKMVSLLLATLMALAAFMTPASLTTVYAGEGEDVTYISEHLGDQWVRNADDSLTQVFCMNEGRAYSASGTESAGRDNTRVKYVWNEEPTRHNRDIPAWAEEGSAYRRNIAMEIALLGNMYNNTGNARTDIGEHEFTFRDLMDGALAGLLTKVLYLGAPNNGKGDNFSGSDTQDAVYWCIYSGKDNPEGEYGNDLVKKALALNYDEIADDVEGLYVYVLTPAMTMAGGSGNTYWEQCFVSASFTGSAKPSIENTTAKVNDTATSVEIAKGTEGTLTDEITFKNLEDGKEYTVVSTVQKDGEDFTTQTSTVKGPETSLTVTFDKKITEAGEYKIKTELKDGEDVVATHSGNFDEESETVTVTVKEVPTITNTTAKVNGNEKTAEIEEGSEGTMTDEVAFESLVEGTTYTVVSTMYKDGEVFGSTQETEITSETESPITVTFDTKITEAGKYTVKTELKAGDEVVFTHNGDLDVESETVTVTVKQPDDSSKEETPTSTRTPGIGTTVTADGVTATASQFARLTYKQVGSAVEVTDTIAYTDLLDGVTYHIIGTLVETDLAGTEILEQLATATDDVAASGASGTFDLSFGNVELKPYKKYVVLETVYAEGGEDDKATLDNPLVHADLKDLAQTIMTENERGYVLGETETPITPKETSSTTGTSNRVGAVKTADNSPIALFSIAFAAAALLLGIGFKRCVR